jgi:hypothetical protein
MEGEKPRADYSGRRMELCIKECPAEVASAFIEYARKCWYGKQWVALKALLMAAENEENWKFMADKVNGLQAAVDKHEIILSRVHVKLEPEAADESEKEKKGPKTFARARAESEKRYL